MALVHRFACPLPNGMHARPASALEEQARRFLADVTLVNERNGSKASLRSVLALVAAEIRPGDPLRLEVAGPDEVEAMAWLQAYVRSELPRVDDVLPTPAAATGELSLPPSLRPSRVAWWPGRPVAGGIGQGRIVEVDAVAVPADLLAMAARDRRTERAQIERGLDGLLAQLERELAQAPPGVAAKVIEAHRSVARDPELRRRLLERVGTTDDSAARAIAAVEAHFTDVLQATGSRLLHERVLDVQDVCARLTAQIYGQTARPVETALTQESIVVADALTPSQFLALHGQGQLRGLALRQAGATSHAVLLARSFRIPTLVGVTPPAGKPLAGRSAVLDAEIGLLALDLDAAARRYYSGELRRLRRRDERVERSALQPGTTRDGWRLEVGVNISSAEEAVPAFAAGAEGVGLFRSEMLFSRGEGPPSEDDQLDQYRRIVTAAAGRTVNLRTLDAGGDKPIPYLELPPESNPFLGRRGVRVYPIRPDLFRTQVRALLRASAAGPLRLLVPMVASVDELRWVKRVVAEERETLAREGVSVAAELPLGVMVETPSVAFALDHLAADAEIFSIGTNDLLQFFFAADRGNPDVAGLADPLQPSFLRLLKQVVDEVHRRHKWVGICGEMAGSRLHLPLLVGMGPDEISVGPALLAETKAELRTLDASACRELLARALECSTAAEVGSLLADLDRQDRQPILTEDLVLLESDSATKAEAIRELVDELFVLGRTDAPFALEQALWEREAASSTGLGHGVAVPHCASRHVRASTVGLLRLKKPVEWGSADEAPVRLVLLLAVREADKRSHLRLLSRLARRLMHEEFRRSLLEEREADALLRQVRQTLA